MDFRGYDALTLDADEREGWKTFSVFARDKRRRTAYSESVHPGKAVALECGYRKILASGRVFYGERRNVD